MSELIDIYYDQIKDYKLLTHEEEIELGKRIKNGDKVAKKILIESNLRLVIFIAKKFYNEKIPFEDYIEVGNLGLIKAVEKWDYSKGYKFSTYATWWIYSYVRKYFYTNYFGFSYPLKQAENIFKVKSYLNQCDINSLNPTYEEISNETGVQYRAVKDIMENDYDFFSIDNDERKSDGEMNLSDSYEEILFDKNAISVEDEVNYNILREELKEVLKKFDKRNADIIKYRFGFYDGRCYSLDEIARKYGVSRETIRQREEKLLIVIKNELYCKYSNYFGKKKMFRRGI